MNTSKRMNYFLTGLALAAVLFLWNPLPVCAFAQNSGGGGQAGGMTMVEVSGKVVETMNSGGYTYALVNMDGSKTWVALPTSRIAVGNEISCKPGMVMTNFRSSSLNRSFEKIVFSGGVTSLSGSDAPSAAAADPHAPSAATPAPEEAVDEPQPKPALKGTKEWGNF